MAQRDERGMIRVCLLSVCNACQREALSSLFYRPCLFPLYGRLSQTRGDLFLFLRASPLHLQKMTSNGDSDRYGFKREAEDSSRDDRRRKRKSRWGGDENDRVVIPGMPTILPPNLSKEQEKIYLLQLQIEEISRRLRIGDYGIPPNPEER